jgi:hypothetical protein
MWSDGHLAQAGREVFIKSVAQALPTYLMGVFKLPFSVCYDLTKLVRISTGERRRGRGKHTGVHGRNYKGQKSKVVSGSVISVFLTKHSSLLRHGD